MKTRLLMIIVFAVTILSLGTMFASEAFGWCPQDNDWPDKPCYAPYQNFGIEKERSDWAPYYDYKGEYWMEQKRYEMEQAIQSNSLEKWLDLSPSHLNVHYYYYLQGEAPDLQGNRIFTCDLYADIKRYDDVLKQDPVLKKFLQKFPRTVSSYDGIDESRPPQSKIIYESDESDVGASLLMRVFEGEDKEPCIVPRTYTLTYNDESVEIEIRNSNADVSEILQFLDSLLYKSPLKQFKSGVPFDEIQCNKPLVLVIKNDISPACVISETKNKLIEREWTNIKTDLWKSTSNWNSMTLVRNYDGMYCNSTNEESSDHCYSLEEIVFGNARQDGWTVYPGGAGWLPQQNSTLTRIYKEVEFGMKPLNFTAMLDDKIFVSKCESNGGVWNYAYHDCEGSWQVCKDVDGITIEEDVTPYCDPFVGCNASKLVRVSCVFEYEN